MANMRALITTIACLILSNVFGQRHEVGRIPISVEIKVKCGRMPVTGNVTLKEAAATKPMDTWQLTVADKNVIRRLKTYSTLGGNYEVILESSCGILSKIGTYCNNAFTFEFFDVADDKLLLHHTGVADLLELGASEGGENVKIHCEGEPLELRDDEEIED